ncbi:hypothetical protein F5Y19DRAFT_471616 [Xylariaceae sp. FL1651]|nr:hypothetical protein F5Y19DRAFT_471616 [Xylariaceae sp. FL1651]
MEQQDVSMVFSMLPTSVQSRIPPFKSLRRSASLSILSSRRRSTGDSVGDEMVIPRNDENQTVQLDPPVEARTRPNVQRKQQKEMTSGVRWRYAEQGTNMHRIAYIEKDDPAFSRKSYIDGVAYMLMALPENLNDHESSVIQDALPASLADVDRAGGREAAGWRPPLTGRTVLQRCVAGVVTGLVVVLHLALWYVSIVVRVGAHYERKHNISQQLVSRGFVIATAVGRHSVVLSAKICAISDGRVGRAMSTFAAWTVESVTCGIQDGIGQGLLLVDQRPR